MPRFLESTLEDKTRQQQLTLIGTLGLGFACLMAWLSLSFSSLKFDGGPLPIESSYLLSNAWFAMALAVFAAVPRIALRLTNTARHLWVIGACMSLSSLLLAADVSSFSEFLAFIASFAGCAFSGIAMALCATAFGVVLSRLSGAASIASVAIGQSIASFFYGFMLTFPSPLYLAACLVLPLAATACLIRTRQLLASIVSEQTARSLAKTPSASRRSPLLQFCGCALAVGFLNEANRAFYASIGTLQGHLESLLFTENLVALLTTLCAVVLVASLAREISNRLQAKYAYRFVFAILFISTLVLPSVFLLPSDSIYVVLHSADSTARNCFYLLIWFIASRIGAMEDELHAVRCFALIRTTWAVGQMVGSITEQALVSYLPVNLGTVYGYVVIAAVGLALVMLTVFPESVFLSITHPSKPQERPSPAEQTLESRCLELASQHGLTKRETELLVLFAQGRNSAYLQQELHLSRSTVSTHRQHIYQKLDIHSHQELLDLLYPPDTVPATPQ